MAELKYLDIGRSAYAPALQLQHRLWDQVAASDEDRAFLVLVEHDPPVITVGRRNRCEHILADHDQLTAKGIELHETRRGGDVTYHGPGQLVGYPIIRLGRRGRDLHAYLRDLEEVVIRTLGRVNIEGRRIEGLTGVWVGDSKIAAIGVAVRRWISYHGFAINVAPDLSHFEYIVPCGIHDKQVTSIERLLGRDISVDELKPAVIKYIAEVFEFDRVSELTAEL